MKQLLLLVLMVSCCLSFSQESDEVVTATYYLIRHAEKDRSNPNEKDPALTEEGIERAKAWATIFHSIPIDKVYSTNYQRTRETAQPTATAKGVDITYYNPRSFDVKAFKQETQGMHVLIVGHSNTTPFFANMLLGGKRYDAIPDDQNGNLYIITVLNERTNSTLLHLD